MATTVIYTIDSTDGGATLVIQPRTINGANGVLRNTDLTLYGNATPNWGERFNENFYRMLENFACEEKGGSPGVPQDEVDFGTEGLGVNIPLQGQLWFNKTGDVDAPNGRLYVQTTPTADVATLGATWEGIATADEVGSLGSGLTDKVDRVGDTMTGKLTIAGGSIPDGNMLEISHDTGPLVDLRTNTLASTPPIISFYNPENDPGAGGAYVYGWTKIGNRDACIFNVEYENSNTGTADSPDVLVIYQSGEMVFNGIGGGTGDIRIPNASISDPNHVTTRDYVDTAIAAGGALPPGVILQYGGVVAPSNFVMCDGSLKDSIADTSLAGLYAVIGITYGGTGPNAFYVPDMRGKTGVGIGSGSFTALGQVLGAETHALTSAENGPHTHTATVTGSTDAESSHTHGYCRTQFNGGGPVESGGEYATCDWVSTGAGTPHSHTITGATVTVNPSGAGTPHNNIQPSMGLNYIISL